MSIRSLLRRWLVACALAGVAAAAVPAEPALRLDASSAVVDVWPAVTVLPDAALTLSLDDVLARQHDFRPPPGPHANFGVRREAMWLRVPLQVSDGAGGAWVLELDYTPINRADVYLLTDGRVASHGVLGNAQAFDERPMFSRAHALRLDLAPGQRNELWVRVQTAGSMLVPLALYRPDAFVAHESQAQLLQGLLAGAVLTLLLYSLAQWLTLRDVLFAQYGLLLFGTELFFIVFFGIGQQYLWHDLAGSAGKILPQSALLAVAAGSLFVGRALHIEADHRRMFLGLRWVTGLSTACLLASLLGLLDYRQTHLAATLLGPGPMLFALPAAFVRARRGEALGVYMMIGWTAYLGGVLGISALLRGVLPVNFWTLHLFQFASALEMLAWMQVLGLRIGDIRRTAERSELDKQALRSLADTDALTGLPNRRGLDVALRREVARCSDRSVLALYLLDLDGFKAVNDRFGHDAGDELLVQVGRRLGSTLRDGDVLARLGGDEFVVMAAGIHVTADAERLGAKMLAAFDAPFTFGAQSCQVGLTIGLALAPLDCRDARDLLKCADAAMYAGKNSGRHCVRRHGMPRALAC